MYKGLHILRKPIRMSLCFLMIVGFLIAFFQTSIALEQYSSVSGIVVDDDGVLLNQVEVQVYTQGGAFVANTSTVSDGSFSIAMKFGTYNIYFTSPGYAKATKSIAVQESYIDMGTLTLSHALKLSATTANIAATIGDEITIPLTLSNIGEKTEMVSLVISRPEDWSARVLNQDLDVSKVYVVAGQSLALQLQVTVPSTAVANADYYVSLKATGTTNSSLTFTISTYAQPIGEVSGRVTEEYGDGIEEVNIEEYSSNGALIESLETFSDGSFAIEIPTGKTVSLSFSKIGYVKVTKTITVTSVSEEVNLGEIILLRNLKLHSSTLGLLANPLDKLLLPFVISNVGEETEKPEFSVSRPEGWQTRVLDQSGVEIIRIELSPGASMNLQLEVAIPLGASGENEVTLTTIGGINSTLSFAVNVKEPSTSVLSCQLPGKSVTPGDTVQFQVKLENPFGVAMRFSVYLDSVPLNWTASIKNEGGEQLTEAVLESNGYVNLLVEIESPYTADTGKYQLFIKAKSSDGTVADSLLLTADLSKPEEQIKIVMKYPEVTVEAGKTIQYPITITNPVGADRALLLSVEAPTDWKVVFLSGSLEISRLYVEAGASENLVIEATPPSTVSIGTYQIPVQIKSESGITYVETNAKATIIGSYALGLESSTLLTSATAGSSTTLTVKIKNTGSTTVTGVKIGVDATGWDSAVSPTQVDSLKPNDSSTFTLVLTTTDDTVAGDYLVTLTGLSDQVESESTQVRVTVTTPTSWGLIGVGIAVVMVIALLVVFMKFRRR